MSKAFILGGTGQIGLAVAERLLEDGWQVTLGSRGRQQLPSHITEIGAKLCRVDRSEFVELASAIDSGCDLLIDTVAFDAAHARQLLAVQHNVGQIIAISSASVYSDAQGRTLDEARQNGFPELPHRMTEEQSTVEPGPSTYSTRKVAMERALMEGAKCPVAVLRPGAIHGPFSAHPREWWFVKRLLDGRERIPLAYDGRSQFQTSATENIGALVSTLAGSRLGGIFNIGDPDAPTVLEIGKAIVAECAIDADLVLVDTQTYPPRVGATPWSVPKPFTISDAKARSAGYRPVGSYRETVSRTCRWLMEHNPDNWRARFPQLALYPYDMFDYAAEDRFISRSAVEGLQS
ncbi:NAD(P)H-binding protein [Erythrobacter donghaensis]|jgi:nucleoside-diphosphate-sugar epimerase|uniref:NAD(P)H-binding protein n=1 Tax=Erythrobacter donghaensis TaxID=267135 RepID=UPI00093E384F|nr:NAD(P)H-binding protein [Erythrobacter donghaensis]